MNLSGQRVVRFESSGPGVGDVMQWLRDCPPDEIGGHVVTTVVDLLRDHGSDEPTDLLVFHLDIGTVSVRPSGVEPMLELRGEVTRPPSHDLDTDTASDHAKLVRVLNAATSLVADPERAMTVRDLAATDADAEMAALAAALFTQAPRELSLVDALRLVIQSIDLTTLAGDDTDGRVRALCAQARQPDPTDATVGPTAAVCVYPNLVPVAVELTKDSGVAVASVATAFPSGLSSLEVRLSDIAAAVGSGAHEIDVVINRAAFLAGHHDVVSDELLAMREQVGSRVMKVILETSELATPAAIRKASHLAMNAGADWIKTSTGKSASGATPVAVYAMAEAIDGYEKQQHRKVGLKISGGVRTSAEALGYLAIIDEVLGSTWLRPSLVRFGASSLLGAVVEDLATARR